MEATLKGTERKITQVGVAEMIREEAKKQMGPFPQPIITQWLESESVGWAVEEGDAVLEPGKAIKSEAPGFGLCFTGTE